jgi:NADH dehydrogenase/NADH:ubiquinone oxidoreductase subunit G
LLSALRVGGHRGGVGSVLLTGNYPSTWVTEDLVRTLEGKFVTLIDTLRSELIGHANVVIPGATWAEKSGTFENHRGILQAFRQAIPTFALAKSEGQICADMMAVLAGSLASDATAARKGVAFRELQSTVGQVADGVQVALPVAQTFDPASVREEMAQAYPTLHVMRSVVEPAPATTRSSDMPVQEL